jgi:hypothetical protein
MRSAMAVALVKFIPRAAEMQTLIVIGVAEAPATTGASPQRLVEIIGEASAWHARSTPSSSGRR